MTLARSCTVTKALVFTTSLLSSAWVLGADFVGTVTHLSGPLLVKKADGTVKVLSRKSTVEQGDTLISEKDTYARIKFTDNSEITLRPNSQLKIESFVFEEDKQEKDSASFSLVKGGLRAITGALGKRSRERVGVNTPAATIGIRGTTFVAEYIPPSTPAVATSYAFAGVASASPELLLPEALTRSDAPRTVGALEALPLQLAQGEGAPAAASGTSEGRAPGLYVHVLDGMINLSNKGGSQNFAAGQFGFTLNVAQQAIILPQDPGIRFAPPPAFSSATGGQGGTGDTPDANDVNCEVR